MYCHLSEFTNDKLDNPKYNIYHDRIPGGIKTLIFDANESTTHESDEIIIYKWFENGNVFQNGSHIESEFAEGQHELVLLIKNEDDIWAVDTFNFEVTSAKIIKNSFNKANNYLIINKGYEDGVIEDMGVISTDGVIGVVNESRAHHSSVISILHQEIKVNVSFKKNGAYGSLSWPGIHPKKMTLDDISTINSVSVGDTIVTGGMSAYFPFGIPIGVVSKFVQPKTEGYYQIEVDLFSNLTQKEFAYVIKNKDLDEIKKLTSDVSK